MSRKERVAKAQQIAMQLAEWFAAYAQVDKSVLEAAKKDVFSEFKEDDGIMQMLRDNERMGQEIEYCRKRLAKVEALVEMYQGLAEDYFMQAHEPDHCGECGHTTYQPK